MKTIFIFSMLTLGLAFLGSVAHAFAAVPPAKEAARLDCLTYLAQFEGAVPYHPAAPKLSIAEREGEKGEKLCVKREQAKADGVLEAALRDLGVSPVT